MSLPPSRGIVLAVGIAVLMHLLLFAMVQPSGGRSMRSAASPPATSYAMQAEEGEGADAGSVRTVKSPVIFSLPSPWGFSHELTEHNVQNQKTFTPLQTRSEYFLEVEPAARHLDEHLHPERLMISSVDRSPAFPSKASKIAQSFAPAKRVSLSPGLKTRLMGGVVLPPELNKSRDKPWGVNASVSISDQGAVEHVFLDHPLESPSLNQQVLQVLYGLRFKPGKAEDGNIELYSPEAGTGGEQ